MLKPEVSMGVALATAAVVYATYQHALPTVADIRTAKPQNTDIDASRRMAAWTSAGLVAGISLVSKDPTVFVVGGGLVVVLDWWYRHANQSNPLTSGSLGKTPTQATAGGSDVLDGSGY